MAMWKLGGLALAAVIGAGLASGPASAMPANGLAPAANQAAISSGEPTDAGGGREAITTVPAITTIMSGRGTIGTGTGATGDKR
jgi:hypothetical protein